MSERWNPKKLRKARTAAIAAGAPTTPVLYPEPDRRVAAPLSTVLKPTIVNTLCRLHGQPWRTCTECSITKTKRE